MLNRSLEVPKTVSGGSWDPNYFHNTNSLFVTCTDSCTDVAKAVVKKTTGTLAQIKTVATVTTVFTATHSGRKDGKKEEKKGKERRFTQDCPWQRSRNSFIKSWLLSVYFLILCVMKWEVCIKYFCHILKWQSQRKAFVYLFHLQAKLCCF